MKYILGLLTIFLFSCTTRSGSEPVVETKKEAAKPMPEMEKTFPFSETDKVEVISFQEPEYDQPVDYDITDGILTFDESKIYEKIELKEKEVSQFFTILNTETCPVNYTVADCYRPAHRIIFYKQGKVIAFLEVCLQCIGHKKSEKLKTVRLCDIKMKELEQYFRQIGIKHFTDY